MRILILCIYLFFGALSLQGRTITDMAGRRVEIPENVARILPYDPKTSILGFPVLKDRMVGTSILPGKKNYQYIDAAYKTMPEVDVKNIEAVLASRPQVILYAVYDENNNTNSVLTLGRRLNIPVVMVNVSLSRLDEAYRFLGDTFGAEEECLPLIRYLENVYRLADSLKTKYAAVPHQVYYSVGPTGLMTDPAGSKHTEVLDYMRIPNAAQVAVPSGGHAQVNIEQVMMWNPDIVLAAGFRGNSSAYRKMLSDEKWGAIEAVKKEQLYQVPSQPLGWLDHPPSVNRIPGVIWLLGIFYHYAPEKVEASIKTFYRLFYRYPLSDDEYQSLFQPE